MILSPFGSVSSANFAGALLPSVNQAQAQLSTLEVESTTGQYASLGLRLGSESGYELSLRNSDDLLQAFTAANNVASSNMSIAQTALSSMSASAQSAAASATQWQTSAGNNPATLQTIGASNLQTLISTANTNAGGVYVFGGENSGVAPLDDYLATPSSTAKTAIDNAFATYFGFSLSSPQVANITSTQLQGFLSGPFAAQFQSPAWNTNWSKASSTNASAEIAPGQTVDTSTNANTPGFMQLAQGYTMLSEFGSIGLGAGAEQTLASAAANVLNQGVSSLTQTQAALGQAQNKVTEANSDMSAQMTALAAGLGKLDDVDAAKIATELSTLTTQLQAAYQLTAQIHKLSLAEYLPA